MFSMPQLCSDLLLQLHIMSHQKFEVHVQYLRRRARCCTHEKVVDTHVINIYSIPLHIRFPINSCHIQHVTKNLHFFNILSLKKNSCAFIISLGPERDEIQLNLTFVSVASKDLYKQVWLLFLILSKTDKPEKS